MNYWLLPVHFFLPIQYLDFCVWTRGPRKGSSLTQWIQYFFKCHQEMHSILLGRIIAWSHSPFGCKHVFFLRSWNRLRQESTDVNWLSVLLCISKRIAVTSHVVCHTGLLNCWFQAGFVRQSFVGKLLKTNPDATNMVLVKSSFFCTRLTRPKSQSWQSGVSRHLLVMT